MLFVSVVAVDHKQRCRVEVAKAAARVVDHVHRHLEGAQEEKRGRDSACNPRHIPFLFTQRTW